MIRETRPRCAPATIRDANSRFLSMIIMTKIRVIMSSPTPQTRAMRVTTVRDVASRLCAMPLTMRVEVVTLTPGTLRSMSAATASMSRPGATLTMTEEMMSSVSRLVYLLSPLRSEESMRIFAVSKFV